MKPEKDSVLRGWLLEARILTRRFVLAYAILIALYLVAAKYLRTHELGILTRIMGRDCVGKLCTLEGVDLLHYIVQDITIMLLPPYLVCLVMEAIERLWNAMRA